MTYLRNAAIMSALLASPLPAFAHHGSGGQFDTSTTIELSGEITRVRLVNPHAYVYFDSTDANGEVLNLRCELQSGSLLKRNGWTTDMFEIGNKISITGSPDRTDPTTCYMSEITFENGVVASRHSTFDDSGVIELEHRQTERTARQAIAKQSAERGTAIISSTLRQTCWIVTSRLINQTRNGPVTSRISGRAKDGCISL